MLLFVIMGEAVMCASMNPLIEFLSIFGDVLFISNSIELRMEFSIMQPAPVVSFQLLLDDVKVIP